MTDTFNVTATFNQNSYTHGQTAIITISGNDVFTQNVVSNAILGPINLTILANNGVTEAITIPAVNVSITTVTNTAESVVISGVSDSNTSHTWVIANNGLSCSAVV